MHGAVDLPALFGRATSRSIRAYEFGGYSVADERSVGEVVAHVAHPERPHAHADPDSATTNRRIPYPQAQQLYHGAAVARRACEFVHYPREGHVVREYRHRWDQSSPRHRWFDRWVR
jgi:hypothetical protein